MPNHPIFGFDFFTGMSGEFDDIMHGQDGYPGPDGFHYGELSFLGGEGFPPIEYTTKLWWTAGDVDSFDPAGPGDFDVTLYSIWHAGFGILGVGEAHRYAGPQGGLDNPWVLQWSVPPGVESLVGFVKRNKRNPAVWGEPYTTESGADKFCIIGGVEADAIKLPKPDAKAGRALGGARLKHEHIVGT